MPQGLLRIQAYPKIHCTLMTKTEGMLIPPSPPKVVGEVVLNRVIDIR